MDAEKPAKRFSGQRNKRGAQTVVAAGALMGTLVGCSAEQASQLEPVHQPSPSKSLYVPKGVQPPLEKGHQGPCQTTAAEAESLTIVHERMTVWNSQDFAHGPAARIETGVAIGADTSGTTREFIVGIVKWRETPPPGLHVALLPTLKGVVQDQEIHPYPVDGSARSKADPNTVSVFTFAPTKPDMADKEKIPFGSYAVLGRVVDGSFSAEHPPIQVTANAGDRKGSLVEWETICNILPTEQVVTPEAIPTQEPNIIEALNKWSVPGKSNDAKFMDL